MKRIHFVIAAILGATIYGSTSHAAPDTDPWVKGYHQFQHMVPQKFEKEVQASFVDAGALRVNGKTFTITGRGTLVYDMPTLPTSGLLTVGNNICHESIYAATATGCAFGDQLLMGVDQVMVNGFGQCTPALSAANAFKVTCCGFLNDAGSFNMPDASYTVSCIR